MLYFFFFKQKTAYELRISDWSSDVCSSDLQRQRHRDHGRTDFPGTETRGLRARHAGLAMARDVFEHDDRVIDDESDRQGQCHQRQRVERIAEQIHDRSEEHTSELQSLMRISYAVFCLKKKNTS